LECSSPLRCTGLTSYLRFKVGITHKHWFNIGVGVMNVANHLDVHN